MLHGTRERFGGSQQDTRCLFAPRFHSPCPGDENESVGVFFPRRLLTIKPLTPLSPLPLSRSRGSAFALPASARLELLRALAVCFSPREEAAKVALTTAS